MPKNPISPVVRDILTENIDLSADDVIGEAKRRGVRAPDKSIRTLVHNIKSDLKKAAAKATPVRAAARTTTPKAAPVAVVATAPATTDLTGVFANVTLVNQVVSAAGGVENARRVAEAVRACGGVDAFVQHLDLVAGIRGVSE